MTDDEITIKKSWDVITKDGTRTTVFEVVIVKEPSQLSTCRGCEETIYSVEYVAKMKIDGVLGKDIIRLCESCFELIEY